jgi:hypothetical protein
MPAARDWEDTIRAVVSHALSQKGCRSGWTVLNHRGHARLNIAAGAGRGRRRQVLLPIPWECDQIDHIRDAVVQVYEEFQQGIEASAFVVIEAYARAQKLLSGKQQTLVSQGDHQALLAALDEETTPTPALREVRQLHQDQVVRS